MARFISRCKNLVVSLTPTNRYTDPVGRVIKKPGIKAQFNNGVFETTKEETILLLRSNYALGSAYYELKDNEPLSDSIVAKLKSRPILVAEGTRSTGSRPDVNKTEESED